MGRSCRSSPAIRRRWWPVPGVLTRRSPPPPPPPPSERLQRVHARSPLSEGIVFPASVPYQIGGEEGAITASKRSRSSAPAPERDRIGQRVRDQQGEERGRKPIT